MPVEPSYGFSLVIDISDAGITSQELMIALFKRNIAVYPGDGLGNIGALDFIRLNISRPDSWAFEKFRSSLQDAIDEARSGVYREDVIKFFEQRPNERSRWILQELKNKGQDYQVAY